MPNPIDVFLFNSELQPEANVDAFLEHMARIDEELAGLLRDNLQAVVSAAEQERGGARKQFTQAVCDALDAPRDGQKGAPA